MLSTIQFIRIVERVVVQKLTIVHAVKITRINYGEA